MNIVRSLMGGAPLTFAYFCLATVTVQVGLGAMIWSQGKLTQNKAIRLAAIVYGLDIEELPTNKPTGRDIKDSDEGLTRDQLLIKRVNANAILADRKVAMMEEAAKIRSLEKELKAERDRRALVRSNFRDYLNNLEDQVVIASLGDVQRTLETLKPKQAKDILLRMLEDEGLTAGDDVLHDVVTIVKAMPEGKLANILAEFKTDGEQDVLHRLVMKIAEFDKGRQP